jgi:hypothetical protein
MGFFPHQNNVTQLICNAGGLPIKQFLTTLVSFQNVRGIGS